ncbi:helix-turn-helix domain containing protein [Asanoa sp. WMMD1127]|uniref:TetR/AcrR family transcriptional regulator n=1 Tax=Asanoa sp. WMMD1127 TaxID=3016107 RepID=UPI0024173400|nr:TetR/AcrR family transcriptional regulator [Asanoa sp. WMMD1127]MDG4823044.1 helix-turn-helix domain containing protein [Asanoa sp. WMMD1127]
MTESTRGRIQAVALELFTENGYEKTSLREIAERLGVTKAALYYHFKSKEEIVSSFAQDRLERLNEIITWAETQPPGPERRQELLSRYADEFFASNHPFVMRFFEQNQTVAKTMSAGKDMRDLMLRVASLMADDADDPAQQLRAALALFAVHGSWFAIKQDIPLAERKRVAIEVAEDLWRPRVSS